MLITAIEVPLADRYAQIKAQVDALTKQLDVLKDEIKATGRDVIEGDMVNLKVSLGERQSYDMKLVQQFLTSDQWTMVCKAPTVYSIINIKAKVS